MIYSHTQTPNRTSCVYHDINQDGRGTITMAAASSNHPGGVNLLLMDGSVRFVKSVVNYRPWYALATPNGAEGSVLTLTEMRPDSLLVGSAKSSPKKAGRVRFWLTGHRRRRPGDLIRQRNLDSNPLFAGDPCDDRPTLHPIVSRSPCTIPTGHRSGFVARSGEAIPVPPRRRFD